MFLVNTAGASISYSRVGQGPPVLLVQGVGAVGKAWTPQVHGLSSSFDLISFDNRGIGKSTMDGGVLSVEAMAEDALGIMDHLGIERFHLVGHSMGGIIAQQVALSAPARVKSLALLCTFCRGSEATRLTMDIMWSGLRTRLGTRAMRRKAFMELILPASVLATGDLATLRSELESLFERDLAEQPPIVMKQLGAMAKYDASSSLGALGSIRTIVVSAAEDRIALPAYGRALSAAIPGSRFVLLPDAAHAVPIHSPEVVNRLVRDHMQAAENNSSRNLS